MNTSVKRALIAFFRGLDNVKSAFRQFEKWAEFAAQGVGCLAILGIASWLIITAAETAYEALIPVTVTSFFKTNWLLIATWIFISITYKGITDDIAKSRKNNEFWNSWNDKRLDQLDKKVRDLRGEIWNLKTENSHPT